MYPGHWSTVFPDKAAVVHSGTGQIVTYKELDDRSNQLAQLMWSLGLRRGDHVSVFMENDVRYLEVIWAALRSGLYLTTVNRYLTDEEAGYIIDNSESQVLITSDYLADVGGNLHQFCPGVKCWLMTGEVSDGYDSYEEAISAFPAEKLAEEPAGTFMLYSSGTTGRPKGILRPLPDNLISDDAGPVGALQSGLWGFDENTIYLSPAPLYHSSPCELLHSTQICH